MFRLTNKECLKLKDSVGGLISFNCFLSTSKEREVSLFFARSNHEAEGHEGVLFEIDINCDIPSSPFASIEEYSQLPCEEEILFSTHTVFRIDEVTVGHDGLHYVKLSLTNNHDNDLHELTISLRKEIEGRTPLHRLGHLLYRLGQFIKAKEIYQTLLGIVNFDELLHINHYVARTYCQMGEYDLALAEESKSLQFNNGKDPVITADIYAGMGEAFLRHGMFEDSVGLYKKALKIADRSQAVGDQRKVSYLNSIGLALKRQEQYNKAKNYFHNALDIALTRFPPTHPDIAGLYQNMGSLYYEQDDFSNAMDYQKKSLALQTISVPANHPSLGNIHYDLSLTFSALHRSSEAIHHGQLALNILKQALQHDHPHLQAAKLNMSQLQILCAMNNNS